MNESQLKINDPDCQISMRNTSHIYTLQAEGFIFMKAIWFIRFAKKEKWVYFTYIMKILYLLINIGP